MAAEPLSHRIFSGTAPEIRAKIDAVAVIAKKMIWADMLKDAKHPTPSIDNTADPLLFTSIHAISGTHQPYQDIGLKKLLEKVHAECTEFATITHALQIFECGFFTKAPLKRNKDARPHAKEIEGEFTFSPLGHVTDGFHDSGYGPKKVRERSDVLAEIKEWNGFSAKFDEGPRALFYSVGANPQRNPEVSLTDTIINRDLTLDGTMLRILGLESYLHSIVGRWEGPPQADGRGRTHLTINTLRNGKIHFAVMDGTENIEIVEIEYPPACYNDALKAQFASFATTFFMGNPTKNAWFNANSNVTSINKAIAEWFLLCKFLGDALQVIECKLQMGTDANRIFRYSMFTGDSFVSGRGNALAEPNLCKSAEKKQYDNVGKGTFYTPQTDKLQFASECVKLAIYSVIDENNIGINTMLKIIDNQLKVDFGKGPIVATERMKEYLMTIVHAILYVNMILELNFKKVLARAAAEAEADAIIKDMNEIEKFAPMGKYCKILYKISGESATVLASRNLFEAGNVSFSNIDAAFIEKYIRPTTPYQAEPYERVFNGLLRRVELPTFQTDNLPAILGGAPGFDIILNNKSLGRNTALLQLASRYDAPSLFATAASVSARNSRASSRGVVVPTNMEQSSPNETGSKLRRRAADKAVVELGLGQQGGQHGKGTLDDETPSMIFYNKIKHILRCIIKNRNRDFSEVKFTTRDDTIASYGITPEILASFIESYDHTWDELEGNVALYFIEIVSIGFYTEYTEYFNRIGYTCLDDDVLQYFLCQYIISSAASYSKGDDTLMTIERFSIEFFNRPMPYLSLFDDVMELKMIKVKPGVSFRLDDIRSTKNKIFEHLNDMNPTRFKKITRQYQEQDRLDVEQYRETMQKLERMNVVHNKSIQHRRSASPIHLKRGHTMVKRNGRRKSRMLRKGLKRPTIKRRGPARYIHSLHETSRRFGGAQKRSRHKTQKRR